MPTIDIEGVGPVEFDESASESDILDAASQLAPAATDWEPPHTPEPSWSPAGEVMPTTPEMQQKVNIALQRIDPRWNVRPPEPTIGRLIGQGMEWINRTFKAPEEPMPAPLTPIVAPPTVEETPEALNRRALAQRIYEVEHPIKAGVGQSAEKLMMTMAEPSGPLALAATPLAPGIMLPAFAAIGTEGSLDAIQRIQKARETGNRAAYYEAASDLLVNAPMVAAPLLHMPRSLEALAKEPVRAPVEVPENLPVVPEQPVKSEVINAPVSERPTTEIFQNVREQPVEGAQEMPAAPRPEGIRGSVETQAQAEVPLEPTKLEQDIATYNTLQQQFSEIAKTKGFDSPEFQAVFQQIENLKNQYGGNVPGKAAPPEATPPEAPKPLTDAAGNAPEFYSLPRLRALDARNDPRIAAAKKYYGAKTIPELARLAKARFDEMAKPKPAAGLRTAEDIEMERVRALPEGAEGEAQLNAEDIAKAVDTVNVDDIAGYSPVPALVRIIRRAPRDPAMKTAAEQAMQKIGAAAKEQGVPLDDIKAQIAGELKSVYGADAAEMAKYYFGESPAAPPRLPGRPVPGEVPLTPEEQVAAQPPKPAPAPKGKEPWRISADEYGRKGMSASPDAAPIKENLRQVEAQLSDVKKQLPSKYVDIGTMSQAERNILASGNLSALRKDINVRRSTLGAAILAGKSRPYEWASRDADPAIRALGQRYNELSNSKQDLTRQIDALTEHKAWAEYAIREGKDVPPEVLADYPDLTKLAPEPIAPDVKRPLNMAGQTRPVRPPPPVAPEFESLHPQSKAKFEAAWEARDIKGMGDLLDVRNRGLRAEFERRAGVKLPRTVSGTRQAVAQWSTVAEAKSAPRVFYDDAVKAYTATAFDEKFGNMHGTGDTAESAVADLSKHIEDARKHGTWRSAEHPTEVSPAPDVATTGAKVLPDVAVTTKAIATGVKSRWVRRNGLWYKAKTLTGPLETQKTPLESDIGLAKSLDEIALNPKPWQRVRPLERPEPPAPPAGAAQETPAVPPPGPPEGPKEFGMTAGGGFGGRSFGLDMANLWQDIKALWQRRPIKRDMAQLADAMIDTIPANKGREAGKELRVLTQERTEGRFVDNALARKAAVFVIQAKGDPAKLAGDLVKVKGNADAEAAIKYAQANWDALQPLAERTKLLLDEQINYERTNGIETEYENHYVPQRHENILTDRGVLFGDAGGKPGGTGFKKAKVFPDYASAIEAGYKPRNLDIADLVDHRVRTGQRLVNRKLWADGFRTIDDPYSKEPIMTDMVARRIPRPDGTVDTQYSAPQGYVAQEIIPGVRVAVRQGYVNLFKALTGTSQIRESAVGRAGLATSGWLKHQLLLLDTFHASRTMQTSLAARGKTTYEKGLSLLEYSDRALTDAVNHNLVTSEMASWIRTPQPFEIGGKTVHMTPREVAQLGQKNGLNVGRFADALYNEAKGVVGTNRFTRWLFEKLTRGAMAETFLSEFGRVSKANPSMDATAVSRKVARDINVLFGNLQRQGIIKNPAIRDLMQMVFLAPQWVESLARREGRAVVQAGKAAVGVAAGKELHVGTVAKTVGTGLAAYVALTQLLNYLSRGHSTLENEEGEHKLDAFIPDPTGESDGFWFSPLSVFGEITHDFIRYSHTEPTAGDVPQRIQENKLGPVGRSLSVLRSGEDPFGTKLPTTWLRVQEAGLALVPLPIGAKPLIQTVGQKLGVEGVEAPKPGALTRQAAGSLGFKIEPYRADESKMQRARQVNIYIEYWTKQARQLPMEQRRIYVERAMTEANFSPLERNKAKREFGEAGVFKHY